MKQFSIVQEMNKPALVIGLATMLLIAIAMALVRQQDVSGVRIIVHGADVNGANGTTGANGANGTTCFESSGTRGNFVTANSGVLGSSWIFLYSVMRRGLTVFQHAWNVILVTHAETF